MTNEGEEIVLVARNNSRRAYHTREDCPKGPQHNPKRIERGLAESWGLRECAYCSGAREVHVPEGQSRPLIDPEDFD